MIMYIEHIIWRFVKNRPEKYRLLDVRHNVMKNLVLGDSNHLIKFILFGDEDEDKIGKENGKIETGRIHIPRTKLWPKKEFKNHLNRDKRENCMELAIYHCHGKFIYLNL